VNQSVSMRDLLVAMAERSASDLHITAGVAPTLRVHGHLVALDYPPLDGEQTKALAYSLINAEQRERFESNHELDFSYGVTGLSRYRVNVYRQRGAVGVALRSIPHQPKSFQELGLPAEICSQLIQKHKGLILMTGPTGQGSYTDGDSLFARDPGATWNDTTKQIENSCAPGVCADGRYYAESPRIVPVSLFDLDAYLNAGYTGSNGYARITNIFGFFVMSRADGVAMAAAKGLDTSGGTSNGKVYGIMVSAPGLTAGTSTIPPTSSFLLTIVLVR